MRYGATDTTSALFKESKALMRDRAKRGHVVNGEGSNHQVPLDLCFDQKSQ